MPAVNFTSCTGDGRANGESNQVVYWSRLLDWKNQTLTPNPDVIYLMPFFNTQDDGPVVLELPPAATARSTAASMNYWQTAIEDVGPGGVDNGKGGKYAFLPPGYRPMPGRLHRDAFGHLSGLRPVAFRPEERQRRGPREGRRLLQAAQALPALAGGEPAATTFVDAAASSSIPRSPTTCASSSRSMGWCRPSHGWTATGR